MQTIRALRQLADQLKEGALVNVDPPRTRVRLLLLEQLALLAELWWYLMPLAASVAIFMTATLVTAPGALAGKLITLIVGVLVCATVGVLAWRLNQSAVRTRLDPFAQHLRELAESLRGD